MASQGYAHLVNMAGGLHGAFDQLGRVVEPGWAACGYAVTQESPPERTWKGLSSAKG